MIIIKLNIKIKVMGKKNLYYSKEGIVFYVSGYDYTFDSVFGKLLYFLKYLLKLSALFKCSPFKIKSYVIDKSSRYKRMRVFYASIKNKCSAYELNADWTMYSWLSN